MLKPNPVNIGSQSLTVCRQTVTVCMTTCVICDDGIYYDRVYMEWVTAGWTLSADIYEVC